MALFEKVWQQMNTRLDQAKAQKEIERLRQALVTNPNDIDALRQLGTLYQNLHAVNEAIDCFLRLSELYQQTRQFDLALAYYRKIERMGDSERRASILKEIEHIHHDLGQYEEAYRTCRQIIEVYLSINQKEAARGFMTTLPTFGEKDEVYRKELREMIGVHDEKWAQGARGTWVDTPPAPTPPAPAAVPYANAPSTASKAAPLPGYPSSRQIKISAEEKAQFADLSILVVDDDPNICTLLTTAIKNIGCQVSTAPNGFEGVDMALRLKPTLIISDLLMPKMDGNQFFTKLQEYPETKDIPFVCLTSRGQEDEKLAAFERGVEDYWVKPFSIAEITMRIKKLMQRQLQQQRPTTSATAAPLSDQIELAGSLAELTPADLLRFTQVKHKTGLLQLKNGDITGVLAFYNGEVIDAKYANLTGEDALYTLLNWHQGTFTFHSQNVPPYRQIVATTDEILSRLMQRYDEEYYLREQLPAPNLTLALSDNFYHSLINAQFPRAIDRLIILFDGQHKLGDCIDQLRGDTEALRLVVDLYQKEMFTVQVNK